MSVETPEFKIVSLDTEPNQAYTGFNFIKACVEFTSHTRSELFETSALRAKLIYQLEEDEIVELQNPDSYSSKTLEKTIRPICDKLQCNITVIVGHNSTCYNYIGAEKIVKPTNSLPTIFLIVACFSHEKIYEYNKRAKFRANNFYFFGFNNIMHLLRGEILACYTYYETIPFMDCRFDTAGDDLKKIEEMEKAEKKKKEEDPTYKPINIFEKPYSEQNDLIKCCMGRYERFKKDFYDKLQARNCYRFTTETLMKKLSFIRKSNGSLQNNLPKADKDFRYIFILTDGTQCTSETKCNEIETTNYETYKANIEKYNDLVKYGNKYVKQITNILTKDNEYTNEQRREKDKEILKIIKEIPQDKAKETLEYGFVLKNTFGAITFESLPIFYYLFAMNYSLSSIEILQKNLVKLDIVYNADSPYHHLYINLLLFIIDYKIKKKKPMHEIYRICKLLALKVPNLFKNDQIPNLNAYYKTIVSSPFEEIYKLNQQCTFPLLFLCIKYFPSEVKYKNMGINRFIENKPFMCTHNDEMKLGELLYTLTPATIYRSDFLLTDIENEILFAKKEQILRVAKLDIMIFYYVYIYKQYYNDTIITKILYWKNALQKVGPSRKKKVQQIIDLYEQCFDFFDRDEANIAKYKRTKEEAHELLDDYLAEYEQAATALEEVGAYFHIVQTKVQKRKNLPGDTKQAEFNKLLQIYKQENATQNEGVLSLQKIKNIYKAFNEHIKTYPKEGLAQPEVRSLQPREKPSRDWLIDEIDAFKIWYAQSLEEKKRQAQEEKKRLQKEKAAARRATLKAERNAAKRQALINAGIDPNAKPEKKKRTYTRKKKNTTPKATNNQPQE